MNPEPKWEPFSAGVQQLLIRAPSRCPTRSASAADSSKFPVRTYRTTSNLQPLAKATFRRACPLQSGRIASQPAFAAHLFQDRSSGTRSDTKLGLPLKAWS